jgi:hypothetical protein
MVIRRRWSTTPGAAGSDLDLWIEVAAGDDDRLDPDGRP